MSRWLLLHRETIRFPTHAKGVVKIVEYGDVRCKRTLCCWITCDRDGISNEYWQAVKKIVQRVNAVDNRTVSLWASRIEGSEKDKGNSVTVVALVTVSGLRKCWFWYTIMRHGQTVNSDPYIVTLKISWKPFRRVLRCRNIAKKTPSTRQRTTTHKFKTQEGTTELSDGLFFPTYHTAQIFVPQSYIFLKSSNIQSMEKISE